ncbi:MAG: TonB-dependent receptor [Terriglobales bacterium]
MRRVLVIWAVLLFSLNTFICAQSPDLVTGTVVDPDHAAVPEAVVRLLAADGRELAHALSDPQGRFSFQQACAGCWLEIQLPGFKTERVPARQYQQIELPLAAVEEHVVVTATRTETPTILAGSTTTVITREEIEARQQVAVSDLLQTLPGVTINRSGGYGSVTSMFTRGGESDYTKVLLDGIPLNEPGGLFDLSSLQAVNLDHIEVVRGPQSALFGSDAMTGVVQLFSQHGEPENGRPHVTLNADGGNLNTLNAGADVNGRSGIFDYDAFWSRFHTDNQGINAAFANSTAGWNVGWGLGKTKLRWILRGDLSLVGTPGQTAFGPAIDDARTHRGDGFSGFSIENQTARIWNQRLTYTFDRTRQVSRDLGLDAPFTPSFEGHTASFEFFDFASKFIDDERRHQIDYQSNVTLGSGTSDWGQHAFTLAFSWDREVGAPAPTPVDDFGGVFQYQAIIGRLSLTNGFRVEDHSLFKKTITPRSSAAYLLRRSAGNFGATKLKLNFGLAFKEPTLIDLFSPSPFFMGNPHLRPERNRSFDFGVEQRLLNDHAKLEINWFDNRFRDLVEFETTNPQTFAGSFFNVNAAKANGAEVILQTAPRAGVTLTAGYTYLNTLITKSSNPTDEVFGVGHTLFRRPRHSGSLGAIWNWQKLTASSTVFYVGSRADSDFVGLVPPITSDPSYTRWDLAWSYRFSKNFAYQGAITNALDRSYMEALGYPALPIEFRMGGRFTF